MIGPLNRVLGLVMIDEVAWTYMYIRAAYVTIGSAHGGAAIYTDSRAKLIDALGIRRGIQVGAIGDSLSEEFPRLTPPTETPQGEPVHYLAFLCHTISSVPESASSSF